LFVANYDIVQALSQDLFTDAKELHATYPENTVAQILRLRDMYTWYLANPSTADKKFVATDIDRHNIAKTTAYEDLKIVKSILPNLTQNSKDFHRWRFNEMILETYALAKLRKDTKTMERAASSYAKYNRIDTEDESAIPYDVIVVQPFTATSDPSVLGITPIPNARQLIDSMLAKYRKETLDIEYVEFEEADLEEDDLFSDVNQNNISHGE